jgi:hypothetical protein
MSDKKKNVRKNNRDDDEWTDECETLLAEWSEKASCYRWLHGRCEKSYKKWYYCFSIPVIILSTLTGAANVGMDSFVPQESKSIASAIVGSVNIFAGIISTLQNFLKVAELMEGHRIAGVSWGKLQRNISIELALDPRRRVLQTDFLKLCRAEYDRLIEAGPLIDDGVIYQFNKKFNNYKVSKPSICNGLDKCNIYKIDKDLRMDPSEFTEGIEDIIEKDEMEDEISGKNFQVKIDEINKGELSDEDVDLLIKRSLEIKKNMNKEKVKEVDKMTDTEIEHKYDSNEDESRNLNKKIQVELKKDPIEIKVEEDINVNTEIEIKGNDNKSNEDNEEEENNEISLFLDNINDKNNENNENN